MTAHVCEGRLLFRYRLILSALTGKCITFDWKQENGVHQTSKTILDAHEISLLRLLDRLTSGTQLEVDQMNKLVNIRPGILIGGRIIHQCANTRGLSYYLEFLAILAPFCKRPVEATLTGLAVHPEDPTIETFQNVTIPILKKLGLDEKLKINKRNDSSVEGGITEAVLTSDILRKEIEPIEWIHRGLLKRIRGVAYASRIPPMMAHQLIDETRTILSDLLADVYIYSDIDAGGRDTFPEMSLSLFGETVNGFIISADCSWKGEKWNEQTFKDVAQETSNIFLSQVMENGTVDGNHQLLILLMMSLSSADLSTIEMGRLTEMTVQWLRDLHDFMGVSFQVEEGRTKQYSANVVMSCIGMGYRNENRKRY
eukprot:jgi/Galph1/4338/GphlegSOOS_G2979.1